jgi:hypothetical protein
MDRLEPLLTPEERDALRPQRPPERFAESVMARVASLGKRRARRLRVLAASAVTVVTMAAAACVVVGLRSSPAPHGDLQVDVRTDVRVGPHVIAVLERGAHIAWNGDDVTQIAGEVFYRFELGGIRRVHTTAADVLVRGTCFSVRLRNTEEGIDMTRRDAVAGALGALSSAAVLVGVYEGRVTLSRAGASVDVASGQGARVDAAGIHGPEELAAATSDFEASAGKDPWRTANANLADQVKAYQRRLDDSQAETKRITRELDALKAKLASLDPDAAAAADPFNPTQDQWKDLAKANVVRAKNFCFPPSDWQPDTDQLADLGLAPSDSPALTKALAAASQRMWQAEAAACAKLVGSMEVAERLGNETCGTIIQRSVGDTQFAADTQLVADIRAGNKPMPPPGQLDAVATRLLAMTGSASDLEKDLEPTFGPEEARRIAFGDTPWSCALQFERPESNGVLRNLGQGSQ